MTFYAEALTRALHEAVASFAQIIIGEDPLEDARRFHVSERGVVLVTPGMLGQEWHHVR